MVFFLSFSVPAKCLHFNSIPILPQWVIYLLPISPSVCSSSGVYLTTIHISCFEYDFWPISFSWICFKTLEACVSWMRKVSMLHNHAKISEYIKKTVLKNTQDGGGGFENWLSRPTTDYPLHIKPLSSLGGCFKGLLFSLGVVVADS